MATRACESPDNKRDHFITETIQAIKREFFYFTCQVIKRRYQGTEEVNSCTDWMLHKAPAHPSELAIKPQSCCSVTCTLAQKEGGVEHGWKDSVTRSRHYKEKITIGLNIPPALGASGSELRADTQSVVCLHRHTSEQLTGRKNLFIVLHPL